MLKSLLPSLACALVVVACGGSGKANEPSATPSPTATIVEPSPAPSDTPPPSATPEPTATPEPSPEPTATPTPQPTAVPLTDRVTVSAQRLLYLNPNVTALAGEVTVVLNNLDTGVPHDLSIDGLGIGADCTGPCTASFTFNAGPGQYAFHCTYHPNMTGTLTLGP